MKGKTFAALASVFALGVAACSPPATTIASAPTTSAGPASDAKMGDMPMTSTARAAGLIRSTGVVTQVDPHAGTITFNHGAIPAINWPAMTMQFHAQDASILQGIAVGDHVSFELKSASEPQIVIAVHKQ